MKKLESDKFPIVEIDWIDSAGDDARWLNKSRLESMPPAKCKSVGYVLEETRSHITIIQNRGESEILGRMTIPKVAITKRKILWKG